MRQHRGLDYSRKGCCLLSAVDDFTDRQGGCLGRIFLVRSQNPTKDGTCIFGLSPSNLCRWKLDDIFGILVLKKLSAPDLRDLEVSAIIPAKLKEFHDLQVPGPKDVL